MFDCSIEAICLSGTVLFVSSCGVMSVGTLVLFESLIIRRKGTASFVKEKFECRMLQSDALPGQHIALVS